MERETKSRCYWSTTTINVVDFGGIAVIERTFVSLGDAFREIADKLAAICAKIAAPLTPEQIDELFAMFDKLKAEERANEKPHVSFPPYRVTLFRQWNTRPKQLESTYGERCGVAMPP